VPAFYQGPQIANPATVNQDIIIYNIRRFGSYYHPIKYKKNKSQINENLSNAATRTVTPITGKNRILIVDDEPDIARLFKLGLEREGGFEVDVYNDPMIALSSYRPRYLRFIVIRH
jgi:PleD family two-component response regulator